jgi:hypothetical protein
MTGTAVEAVLMVPVMTATASTAEAEEPAEEDVVAAEA